jgi:hypothetical protein
MNAVWNFGKKIVGAFVNSLKGLPAALAQAITGLPHSVTAVVKGAVNAMWNLGKKMVGAFVNALKGLPAAVKGAVHGATSAIPSFLGNLALSNPLVGGGVGIVNGAVSGVKGLLGLFGKIKFHNGGIVPGPRGSEVPAILQAGEAVISLNQMRNGGGHNAGGVNVAPNAVNITINGNTDNATVEDIKRHVEEQFRQLRYAARTLGR